MIYVACKEPDEKDDSKQNRPTAYRVAQRKQKMAQKNGNELCTSLYETYHDALTSGKLILQRENVAVTTANKANKTFN